jgi:hypothetical protein
MAVSVVGLRAEMARPSAAPTSEEVALESAAQVNDAQQDQALEGAESRKNGEFREDVGRKFEVHHAFPLVDRPLTDDVAGGVVAAEPNRGDDHEELYAGNVSA